ncbi:MAG: right-handed parallel beta-helix repeat-containing protein [Polyangiaceae bacterium]
MGARAAIRVSSGAELVARGCSFRGGAGAAIRLDSGASAKADDCAFATTGPRAVVARAGAVAALDGCSFAGSGVKISQGAKVSMFGGVISSTLQSALRVSVGATLTATSLKIEQCSGAALVLDASTAKLDQCQVIGSSGLFVEGPSKLSWTSGRIEQTTGPALFVGARSIASLTKLRMRDCDSGIQVVGGKLELNGGVVESSGTALIVTGSTSSAVVAGVEISGASPSSIEVSAGASLELNGSVVRDSTGGIGLDGRSSIRMVGCQVLRVDGVGVAVTDGARAELHRCGVHHVTQDAVLVSGAQLSTMDCRFTSSGGDGVACQLEAKAHLENTLLEAHARYGAWTQGRAYVELSSCTIQNCRAGDLGGESAAPPSSRRGAPPSSRRSSPVRSAKRRVRST